MKYKYNDEWLPLNVPITLDIITILDSLVLEEGQTSVQKEIDYPDGFGYVNSRVVSYSYGFTEERSSRICSPALTVSESENTSDKLIVTYNADSAAEADTTIYVEIALANITNVSSKLDTYSTSETLIGTWLGKPLYRKVITGTFNGTGEERGINLNVNVDTFVGIEKGMIKVENDSWVPIPYTSPTGYYKIGFTYSSSSNAVILNTATNGSAPYDYYFEVLYTKSTE